MSVNKKRDVVVDVTKGIAALIVVLGHVFQQFSGHENSLLFNIIISIQMPLFFIISGYCVTYSKRLDSIQSLLTLIKKKTISLMLPWLVWSSLRYIYIYIYEIISRLLNTLKKRHSIWKEHFGFYLRFGLLV